MGALLAGIALVVLGAYIVWKTRAKKEALIGFAAMGVGILLIL